MTHGLSDQLLSQLSEFVAGHMGLHFPRERWRDLERGLLSATRELGAPDAESCAQWLLSAPFTRKQIEVLASNLTVGETYFFREKRGFAILGDHILPELIRARQKAERRLRIWSAGCCTGEEPYSIAILLDRIVPDLRQWHVTILGTDINPRFLQKAAEGVFGEWSFRDAPLWLKENYFAPVGAHRFAILPRIKEMVTFVHLNLAEETYPSFSSNTNAMDLIFCRNVLMYFAAERAQRVIHNFHRSLVDGGWLIVSPTETSVSLFSPFAPIHFDGAILYKKESKHSPALTALFPKEITSASRDEEAEVSSSPTCPAFVFTLAPPPSVLSPQPYVEPIPQAAEEPQTTDDRPILYQEALALFEQGDYHEAARKLKSEPEPFTVTVESSALLARICANLGELTEAREWAEKAIAADKLNAGLHYLHAIILQEQGATEEAVASLKRALYLDPDFVLAYFALGNLALRQRRFKEADKQFTNVLTLLKRYQNDEVLPLADGLAAGRLKEMIQSTMAMERPA